MKNHLYFSGLIEKYVPYNPRKKLRNQLTTSREISNNVHGCFLLEDPIYQCGKCQEVGRKCSGGFSFYFTHIFILLLNMLINILLKPKKLETVLQII